MDMVGHTGRIIHLQNESPAPNGAAPTNIMTFRSTDMLPHTGQLHFIYAILFGCYLEVLSIEGVPKNRINPVFYRIDSVFYRIHSVAGKLMDLKGPLILFFTELILFFTAFILLQVH